MFALTSVFLFVGCFALKQADINFSPDVTSIKKQVDTAYENGFKVSLSLKPVFNTKRDHLTEFYKLIDTINTKDKEDALLKRSKLSVKLRQLGVDKMEQDKNFISLLKRAQDNNVFVWISAVMRKDLEHEFEAYVKARESGFTNIGLTISTYNKSCHDKVDAVLAMNGHVRLVKGFYSGDIKDWSIVTKNYLENARKLCASDQYHFLASHDFKVLDTLRNEYGEFNNIEVGFFYFAKDHALKQMKKYAMNFPHKSFYIFYGDTVNYLLHNALHVDSKRIFKRRIVSKFIDSERITL